MWASKARFEFLLPKEERVKEAEVAKLGGLAAGGLPIGLDLIWLLAGYGWGRQSRGFRWLRSEADAG